MSTTTPPRRKLLICTIMRDCLPHLDTWVGQLRHLLRGHPERITLWPSQGIENLLSPTHTPILDLFDVEISVYENDSVDNTGPNAELRLQVHLNKALGVPIHFRSETLGTQRYGSVWSTDRLHNLAAARQACLDQVEGGLERFDKICYIEPDVTYDPVWLSELILARHPIAAGLGEPDIYSAWSLRPLSNPKESVYLYDTCATRAGCDDICWDVNESGGTWRGKSLVPTNLGGVDSNCLHRVWSTFNCFCVYNAKPFKEGVKWGFINKRIDPSGIWFEDGDYGSGWCEADTVNICEQFRERGYGGIYLNTNCLVRHN